MGKFCFRIFADRNVFIKAGKVRTVEFPDAPTLRIEEKKDPWKYIELSCTQESGPHWQDGKALRPVVLVRGDQIHAQVGVQMTFSDPCGMDVALNGHMPISNDALTGHDDLSDGDNEVEVAHGHFNNGAAAISTQTISWDVNPNHLPPTTQIGSTTHEFWLLLGPPRQPSGLNDQGMTRHRVKTAIQYVSQTSSTDPHTIMRRLMMLFPRYTPMAVFKRPHYGIWDLAPDVTQGGECQAICRFCEAMFRLAGCPGDTQIRWVYADPSDGGGTTALWTDDKDVANALHNKPSRVRIINGKECHLALIAQNPTVAAGDRITEPCNDFEACLILNHNGTRYYAGGFNGHNFASEQEVLFGSFRQLVWYSKQEISPTDTRIWCEQVVATYPAQTLPPVVW